MEKWCEDFPTLSPPKINLSNLFWLNSDTSKTCPTSRKQVFWAFSCWKISRSKLEDISHTVLIIIQGKKTSNLCDTHYNLNFNQIHLIQQKWTTKMTNFLCLMSHEYFTVILMYKVNTRNEFMDMSVWCWKDTYFVALLRFWAEQYST